MTECFSKRENEIIKWARESYHRSWNPAEKNEGIATKNSNNVHDDWQEKCLPLSCTCEKVIEKLSQKFDVFDAENSTVYEMKVSGNNPEHEFYKDIFKVIIYNKNSKNKIKKFFFLTERKGIESLKKPMFIEIKNMMEPCFSIELVPLDL